MSDQDIIAKLNQFITIVREEASKLTDDERKHISNLEDYFPNCQIIIIKLGGSALKHMIVTHDEDRPDLYFELHEIETWNAVEKLEEISLYPYWDREFPDEEQSHFWNITNYKELIEGRLIGFIHSMENSLYMKPVDSFWGSRMILHKRDFIADFFNEDAFDPEIEAKKIIKQAINQHRAEQNKPQQEQPKKELKKESDKPPKGYGSYIYPPVWLNEYPELSFREKIRGTRASYYFHKESITSSYKGKTAVVEENGYMGILEEDRLTANRYLNEIIGTGLLFGFPFFSIRDSDMSEFGFQKGTTKIGSREIIPHGSIIRQFDRGKAYWEPDINPHLAISAEGFIQLLKLSEVLTNESEVGDCITLYAEAYTCLKTSQYMQSFIVSWTIIEKSLYWVWEKHLKNKKVNHKRRKHLTGSDWSIARVIEMLEVNDLITKKDYQELTDLRQKRNDLVHEGETVHKEEAEKCFEYATNSLTQRTMALNLFSKDELTKHILQRFEPHNFRF